jgi:molecular chaperone GrpE (heat shock protein)
LWAGRRTERLEGIESSPLTDSEDIAAVAGQLADLTHGVEEMKNQLETMRLQAETQQSRADTQQERIDLAARELAEVSDRLQAAARALRQSI